MLSKSQLTAAGVIGLGLVLSFAIWKGSNGSISDQQDASVAFLQGQQHDDFLVQRLENALDANKTKIFTVYGKHESEADFYEAASALESIIEKAKKEGRKVTIFSERAPHFDEIDGSLILKIRNQLKVGQPVDQNLLDELERQLENAARKFRENYKNILLIEDPAQREEELIEGNYVDLTFPGFHEANNAFMRKALLEGDIDFEIYFERPSIEYTLEHIAYTMGLFSQAGLDSEGDAQFAEFWGQHIYDREPEANAFRDRSMVGQLKEYAVKNPERYIILNRGLMHLSTVESLLDQETLATTFYVSAWDLREVALLWLSWDDSMKERAGLERLATTDAFSKDEINSIFSQEKDVLQKVLDDLSPHQEYVDTLVSGFTKEGETNRDALQEGMSGVIGEFLNSLVSLGLSKDEAVDAYKSSGGLRGILFQKIIKVYPPLVGKPSLIEKFVIAEFKKSKPGDFGTSEYYKCKTIAYDLSEYLRINGLSEIDDAAWNETMDRIVHDQAGTVPKKEIEDISLSVFSTLSKLFPASDNAMLLDDGAKLLSADPGDQAMVASKVNSVFEVAGSESITVVPGQLNSWMSYMKLPGIDARRLFNAAIEFTRNKPFATAVSELAEAVENRSKVIGKEGAITEAKLFISKREGNSLDSIPETQGTLGPPKTESIYSMKFFSIPETLNDILSTFSSLGNKNLKIRDLKQALTLLKESLLFIKEDDDSDREFFKYDEILTIYLATQGFLSSLLGEINDILNVLDIPSDRSMDESTRKILYEGQPVQGDLLRDIQERVNPLLRELAAVFVVYNRFQVVEQVTFTQEDIDTYLTYRQMDLDPRTPAVHRLVQRVGQSLKLPPSMISTVKKSTIVRRAPSKLNGDAQHELDDFRNLFASFGGATNFSQLIPIGPHSLNRIHELADLVVSDPGNLRESEFFTPMTARPFVNVVFLPEIGDLKNASSQAAVAQTILKGIINFLVSDRESGFSWETIDQEVLNILFDCVKIFIDPQATEFHSSHSAEFIRMAGNTQNAMQVLGDILLGSKYLDNLKNLENFRKEFDRLVGIRFTGEHSQDFIKDNISRRKADEYGRRQFRQWQWWLRSFRKNTELTRKARAEAALITPEQEQADSDAVRNAIAQLGRMGEISKEIAETSLKEFLKNRDISKPYKSHAEAIAFLSEKSWDKSKKLLNPEGIFRNRNDALALLRVSPKFVLYDLGEDFYLIGPVDAVEPDAAMLASEDMGVKLATRLLFVAATCFGCGEGEQSLEPAKGTDGAVERVLSSRRLGNAPAIVHQLQSDNLDMRLQVIKELANLYFGSQEDYIAVALALIDRYSVYPDFNVDEHMGAEPALLDLLKEGIQSGRLESIPPSIIRALIHKDGDPNYTGHYDTLINLLGIHYESVMQAIEEFVYRDQLSANELLVIRKLLSSHSYQNQIFNFLQNKYPHINLDYLKGVVKLGGLDWPWMSKSRLDIQSDEFKDLAEDAKKFLGSVRSKGQDYLKSLFIDPPPAERDLNYANFAMAVALVLYDQNNLNDNSSFSHAAFTFINISHIYDGYPSLGASGAHIGVPFIEEIIKVENFVLALAHEIGHHYASSILSSSDWDILDIHYQSIQEFIADTIAFTVTDEQHVRGFLTEEDNCPNCDLLAEDDYTKSDESHVSARMFTMKLLLAGHEIDWPVMVQAISDLKGTKDISFEEFAERTLEHYLKRKTGKGLELPKDTEKETRRPLPEGMIWPEGSIWISSKKRIDQIFEWYLSGPNRLEDTPEDQAMLGQKPGGIDFNAKNLNLKEQGQGQEINFSLDSLQNIQPDQVNGILPVIINIVPVTNLPLLLGLSQDNEEKISKL
ncbi:MAG: hypothetical protein Q7S13_01470 [Candidatus Omnitrophota bacterium]|nr:hypothetical protein [Candidatus Omnitrophota bacterium]